MKKEREELEEELVAQARMAIRTLVEELPSAEKVTLSDMERATGKLGQKVMQAVMQQLVESQTVEGEEVVCEECQGRMTRRGRRRKRVVTRRGEVEIERQYYVCPTCGGGRFPPG